MAKFVVVDESWDYDDESYSQPEGEPYFIASKLYNTKAEAQAEADRLNETGGLETEVYNEDTEEMEDQIIHTHRVEKIEE